jgi:hypothetical protein
MIATQMEERSSREAVLTRRKAAPEWRTLFEYPVLALLHRRKYQGSRSTNGLTFGPNGIFDSGLNG